MRFLVRPGKVGHNARQPRVGKPRIYGATVLVLYPGETASAVVSQEAVAEAEVRGETEIQIEHWTVEPTPGFVAWTQRLRFRVFSKWWKR